MKKWDVEIVFGGQQMSVTVEARTEEEATAYILKYVGIYASEQEEED